jgi:hypothetical protein
VRRSKTRSVPVEIRWEVLNRDKGCIAVQPSIVGEENVAQDQCRNGAGWLIPYNDFFQMTMGHVKSELAMGYRPEHRREFLVAQCQFHNETWAPTHHDAERLYLARLYPDFPDWALWLARREGRA